MSMEKLFEQILKESRPKLPGTRYRLGSRFSRTHDDEAWVTHLLQELSMTSREAGSSHLGEIFENIYDTVSDGGGTIRINFSIIEEIDPSMKEQILDLIGDCSRESYGTSISGIMDDIYSYIEDSNV